MQLNQSESGGKFVITQYEPGNLVINQITHHRSVIVGYDQLISDWSPTQFSELTEQCIEQVLELKPQIVLLGTGATQQFPEQSILAPLYKARLGVEIMDTRAACHTYNLLIAEDRKVVAALIV